MAEYIVEFDKTQYDEMVADGILKEADNPTLYGMPVQGEIIRCRDCKDYSDYDSHDPCCYHFDGYGSNVEPNGFCAWAVRRYG